MTSSLSGGQARPRAEILGEMTKRAHHRIRREAAQRAQRSELERRAEVFQQREVLRAVIPRDDAVDHLGAARRADATWRALAAGFDGAEFHCEARLPRH